MNYPFTGVLRLLERMAERRERLNNLAVSQVELGVGRALMLLFGKTPPPLTLVPMDKDDPRLAYTMRMVKANEAVGNGR